MPDSTKALNSPLKSEKMLHLQYYKLAHFYNFVFELSIFVLVIAALIKKHTVYYNRHCPIQNMYAEYFSEKNEKNKSSNHAHQNTKH